MLETKQTSNEKGDLSRLWALHHQRVQAGAAKNGVNVIFALGCPMGPVSRAHLTLSLLLDLPKWCKWISLWVCMLGWKYEGWHGKVEALYQFSIPHLILRNPCECKALIFTFLASQQEESWGKRRCQFPPPFPMPKKTVGVVLPLEDTFSLLLLFGFPYTASVPIPLSSTSPLNLISLVSYGTHFL